ncbi:MAG: flagellar secretion chaperone FliS [Clostridiales bacterium]|nr:flagellar secretion chaperone FliS [Clostridiales bacterium]
MEQEKLNAYSARVTQANKTELIVISYEILLDSLDSAKEALEHEKHHEFLKDMKRAQKILHELTGSLNYQFALSMELMSLYRFCGRCIVKAIYQKSALELLDIKKVITPLKEAFEALAKEDTSEAVMQNTQAIYAGLTYGKHALNEVFVNINEANRGFRA